MASGSSGGKGSGRRKGAQGRLTYRQMQASKAGRGRAVRRMRIARADASIPF